MKITEDNFIRQLRLRNEKALLYVMEQYGGLIKSVIIKHLYSFEDCQEECMNDVLLGIWNNVDCFDITVSSFKNWVAGIARFKSLDYLRKYSKERERTVNAEMKEGCEDEQLNAVLEERITAETKKLLSCLSQADQELLLRVYVEEDSMDEIAEATGMKKSVLYNRISRGKRKIRQSLSGNERGRTI